MKVFLILILFTARNSLGQIYFHNFGTAAISTNPYTVAPTTIDANLSTSQWSSSTGTFVSFAGNGGSPSQALSLSNSAGSPSLILTFNVVSGCALDITSFNFWRQRSTTGSQTWTLTINGIFVGSGLVPTAGAFIGNTSVANVVSGLTGNVSVILSISGATGAGTFRLDDFTLNGSTSCGSGCVPPVITSQPISASTTTAGTASYMVVASGTSPTYQWQQNSGAGFTNIINGGSNPSYSGATSSSLTISNPPLSMSGYSYQCVVTNTCGTATTNGTAIITITSASSGSCTVNGAMGASYNAGCGSGTTTPCDLASVYSSFGTFCGASATVCGTLCAVTNVSTTYNFESGCTATITAEFKARTIAGSNCSNSAMDSGDKLSIINVGGVVSNQSSTMVVASTCGTYPLAGTYTTSTSNLTTGCGNSGGLVQMIVTGGATTIAGTMDRGDEILTYTLNTSGTCSVCPVLLPVGFLDFYGIKVGENNEIFWKVIDEVDIEFYMIEKSNDGINFDHYGTKQVNYNETSPIKMYSMIDDSPYADITYYRISVREHYGITKIYNIISLDRLDSFDWKCNHYQQEQNLVIEFKNSVPKNSNISLFDLSGKLLAEEEVKNSQTKINVQNFAEGIYFVRITTPYKTENFKIIIIK